MSKILRSLGLALESEVPAIPVPEAGAPVEKTESEVKPDASAEIPGDDEFALDETEVTNITTEQDDLNTAGDEVAQTVVTLETINTILANAPEDQINETTAAIVDAAIQDINGRFEIAKAKELSIESFRNIGVRSYRQIAKEEVADKIATFKNGLKNIMQKIIELMQKFWTWLTANHQKAKNAILAAAESTKDIKGSAELTMKPEWRHLMKSETFKTEDAVAIGKTLADLCVASASFVSTGFSMPSEGSSTTAVADRAPMEALLTKTFSKYASANRAGTFLLYGDIGDRRLLIDIQGKSDTKTTSDVREPISVTLSKNEKMFHSPDTITVKGENIAAILAVAVEAVDASEKEFDRINRMQKQLTSLGGKEGTPNDSLAAFRSYGKCLSAFINGIFLECLKFGGAATSVAGAYAKHATESKDISAEA